MPCEICECAHPPQMSCWHGVEASPMGAFLLFFLQNGLTGNSLVSSYGFQRRDPLQSLISGRPHPTVYLGSGGGGGGDHQVRAGLSAPSKSLLPVIRSFSQTPFANGNERDFPLPMPSRGGERCGDAVAARGPPTTCPEYPRRPQNHLPSTS